MYIEIPTFDVDELDEFFKTTYEKHESVVFIVYFSKVPLRRVLNIIPVLEKYRMSTRNKLEKTIIHVETENDKWIAKRLLSLIRPEKSVEIVITSHIRGVPPPTRS
jgi:hypothetical protein